MQSCRRVTLQVAANLITSHVASNVPPGTHAGGRLTIRWSGHLVEEGIAMVKVIARLNAAGRYSARPEVCRG